MSERELLVVVQSEYDWVAEIVRGEDGLHRASFTNPTGGMVYTCPVTMIGHALEFHRGELDDELDFETAEIVANLMKRLARGVFGCTGLKVALLRDPSSRFAEYTTGIFTEVYRDLYQPVVWSDLHELEELCFPPEFLGLFGYGPDTDTIRIEEPELGQTMGLLSVNWEDRHVIDLSVLPVYQTNSRTALGLLMRLRETAHAKGVMKIIADLRHETTARLLESLTYQKIDSDEYTITVEVDLRGKNRRQRRTTGASKVVLSTTSRFVRDNAMLALRNSRVVAFAKCDDSGTWEVRVPENADDQNCAAVVERARCLENQVAAGPQEP